MKISFHIRHILLFAVCAAFFLAALNLSQVFAAEAPSAAGRITEPDGVNIRSSYSTSSSVAGMAPYNTSITISQERFTAKSTAADTIWYRMSCAYGSGYVRSDLASVSYAAAEGKTTDSIHMRTGPGTEFSSAGTLAKGAKVSVVLSAVGPSGDSWYKISRNGSYYYVSAKYVTVTGNSSGGSSGGSGGGPLSDREFEEMMANERFPESYQVHLRKLHALHPTWRFKAKHLGYTWDEAFAEQISNVNANTIASSFPDAYKAVKKGTYNFDTHTYLSKDGPGWVAASERAVAYYMDPRNWLEEESIFMFEPNTYNPSYQTENLVRSILSATALPAEAAKYYISAAQQTYNGTKYSISPIYLASKTRIELGSSDFMINGHEFTYGGKKYKDAYNAYNIGASDSADGSAALKGLVFAAGGSDGSGTSYLRPWNTLEKAVKGGALYIAGNFLVENQYTVYSERYNVYNGLSAIGTHQYATSIFTAATQASIVYSDYKDFGVLDEAFEFEIPVYTDMPSKPAAIPPTKGNNNSYLDGITVSAGSKKLSFTENFDRFQSTYTVKTKVGRNTDKLTIKADPNASDASVTISGNALKEGENKITIKVKSSSGLSTRTYYVKVTKDNSIIDDPAGTGDNKIIEGVEATTLKASSKLGDGYIQVSWEKSPGYKMDYYQVFRSTTKGVYGNKPYFTTKDGTKTTYKNTGGLKDGTRYYYKVRGVRVIDGEEYYSKWSNEANRTYTAAEAPSGNEKLIEGVQNTELTIKSEQGDGYIRVDWQKSPGYKVDFYEVFRSTDKEKFESEPYYKTSDGNKLFYKNTKDLKKGTRYYYKVRGVRQIDGDPYYTKWSKLAYRTYAGGASKPPENQKLIDGVQATTLKGSSAQGDGFIRLEWKKSPGYKVDFYEVFRSTDKEKFDSEPYYRTPDGDKLFYKNTKSLKKGTRYYYKVRGVRTIDGDPYYTKWSNLMYRTYKGAEG